MSPTPTYSAGKQRLVSWRRDLPPVLLYRFMNYHLFIRVDDWQNLVLFVIGFLASFKDTKIFLRGLDCNNEQTHLSPEKFSQRNAH